MSFLFFRSRPLARRMLLAAFALGPVNLHAAPVVTLPELDVDAADTPPLLDRTENANAVSGRMLRQRALSSPDSADLLSRLPGVSLYGAGGISSLPVINGMADDRVATSVDGVRIPPACPNHMNPAMSYISPDMVTEATAVAGITPVSMGGDSIAGTISVERKDPRFARRGKILFTGWARGAYHSNGNGWEGGLSSTVAGDWWSLNYSASYAERGDYHAGGGGGRVLSSSYKTYSHSVTAGFHKDNHVLALTFAQTDTPYEGFPNQYMDMTNNRSSSVNGKYSGAFDWGTLDVRGYWQRVNHAMNMLDDKGGHTATTGMPMNDDSRSAGYNIKATIPLGARNTLRLGNSFDHQGLNDWWPPLAGSMMMGPDTYHNINGGVRDRLGDYAEWESRITPSFHTLLGFRNDLVMMNTGSVSPYAWANGMSGMSSMGGMSGMGGMAGMGGMGGMAATDSAAANAFNAQNHRHTDVNFDVTALVHWDATRNVSIEGGYARKTRSPNFFERYAWGQSQMASQMIGWFGDGNGYVGNNNLSPEVANTASLTADFHDDARKLWNVKIQPYYTYVHHYVNVTRLKVFSDGFDQLKFVNHNAQIYGINSSASYQAWSAPKWGTGVFSAKLDWVRGQDLQTHTGLYHQMPTNGFIALDETYGDFTGRAEIQLVKRKSSVDALRSEPRTPGYALLNLTAGYKWRMMRFELGLDNVLNQRAYQPLGGYALGNYKADGDLMPVAVMGRSVNASIMASF